MKQVILRHKRTKQIVWVDRVKEIKEGSIISLKGDPTKWSVEKIYSLEKHKGTLNTRWNVGGL